MVQEIICWWGAVASRKPKQRIVRWPANLVSWPSDLGIWLTDLVILLPDLSFSANLFPTSRAFIILEKLELR